MIAGFHSSYGRTAGSAAPFPKSAAQGRGTAIAITITGAVAVLSPAYGSAAR